MGALGISAGAAKEGSGEGVAPVTGGERSQPPSASAAARAMAARRGTLRGRPEMAAKRLSGGAGSRPP
jgi:hypothetical protein